MLSALGQVLPIAVAVALSSVPITATILILLSPQRNLSGTAFLIGWVAGLTLVVVAAMLGARALPATLVQTNETAIGVTEIVLGAALVLFGVFSGVRAVRNPTSDGGVKWLRAVKSFGPGPSLGLGLVLNFRPKGLLLGVAAGLAISADDMPSGSAVIVVACYVLISACTVAVPIISTIAMPELMQPRLVSAQHWLERHGRVVTAMLMVLIGVVVIGVGIGQL